MKHQRPLASVLAALGLLAACATASAQTAGSDQYPSRAVRVIVPYSPGGANDILARTVVTKAIAEFGQNTIVDNRAGGNTTIGTQLAARAAPDGYTLLTVDNAYTAGPGVQINLPYDTLTDAACNCNCWRTPCGAKR
jgi:tripartite-type tricarboxylate transporter receptor subunit TctC